jgi:predicted signal transduction protein with EAL and GGDEF domain
VWTEGDFADALAHADEALYRAKRAGKSQAQFYPADGLADTMTREPGTGAV